MTTPAQPGTLIISLDFELMWGMFDKVTHEQYGTNLDGVWDVIPKILALFERYEIHATWATVGMLMATDERELLASLPAANAEPSYTNPAFSSYNHLRTVAPSDYPRHYFAPELVARVIATPNQELASHTYAHYYCLEEQTGGSEAVAESFNADCRAFQTIAKQFGVVTSMVFPRNQWSKLNLTTLAQFGFTAFRGNPNHYLYRARTEEIQTKPILRAWRLIDHYLNLTGHHTFPLTNAQRDTSGLINLPASRFLRPWSKRLALFEPLRRRRIKLSLREAARRGQSYHLWWHPHNFGQHQEQNLAGLESILRYYVRLKRRYGMRSSTMAEAARHVLESAE